MILWLRWPQDNVALCSGHQHSSFKRDNYSLRVSLLIKLEIPINCSTTVPWPGGRPALLSRRSNHRVQTQNKGINHASRRPDSTPWVMALSNLTPEIKIKKPDPGQQGDDQIQEMNILLSVLVPRATVMGHHKQAGWEQKKCTPLSILEASSWNQGISSHHSPLPLKAPQKHPFLGHPSF